jgi:hypothetical protein
VRGFLRVTCKGYIRMKKLIYVLIVLLLASVILIITKPSNQQCIDSIEDKIDSQVTKTEGNGVIASFTRYLTDIGIDKYNQYLFKVEDCTFYKDIYITGSSERIGIAALGMVIFTNKPVVEAYLESQKPKPSLVTNVVQGISNDVHKIENALKKKPENNAIVVNPNASIQDQLQQINSKINEDQASLERAEKFHFGRLPGQKRNQINAINQQLEADKQQKQSLENQLKNL